MKDKESIKPDKIYRVWESTKDLVPFSSWLPEVVGQTGELLRIGSVPVDLSQDSYQEVIQEPLRFIDADVTAYRNLLSLFRKRHKKPVKNSSR
jgi:hypothetical protein